jgi:glyoxylase-like metal-dependent hydrolase (beta-lactamase superfamily II)
MTNMRRIVGEGSLRAIVVAWVLATVPFHTLHAQDELKINLVELSDRVLVTWGCDHFQGTNMAVVVTEEGLVVIDTGLSSTTVRRQREAAEEHLGRNDFRYLINTHMHNDHAFANEVFPEATVVGHEGSAGALQREIDRIPELLDRLRQSQASFNEWAAATDPDSLEGMHAREGVAAFAVGIADLERGVHPPFPAVTFDHHHTVDMGDRSIELFDFRGFHSDSDILVVVPEERVLFTGDVFWGGQLPLLRAETRDEVSRLLTTWGAILDQYPDLEHTIPGHSDVPLTMEQFRGMYQYFSRLWEDIEAAKEAGTTLLRFLMQYVFEDRYPEVADFNVIRRDYNMHQHNVYVLWFLAE